jgi:hypothetical protein
VAGAKERVCFSRGKPVRGLCPAVKESTFFTLEARLNSDGLVSGAHAPKARGGAYGGKGVAERQAEGQRGDTLFRNSPFWVATPEQKDR